VAGGTRRLRSCPLRGAEQPHCHTAESHALCWNSRSNCCCSELEQGRTVATTSARAMWKQVPCCAQIITETGGMTAPDARVAFLTAVLGNIGRGSGTRYSHEQMMDPAQFVPLLARALPLYVNGLKVRSCGHIGCAGSAAHRSNSGTPQARGLALDHTSPGLPFLRLPISTHTVQQPTDDQHVTPDVWYMCRSVS